MNDSLFPDEWIIDAVDRIHPYIVQTPLIYDIERDLYLKCENRQITGSFKVRGALNKALTLQPWEENLDWWPLLQEIMGKGSRSQEIS